MNRPRLGALRRSLFLMCALLAAPLPAQETLQSVPPGEPLPLINDNALAVESTAPIGSSDAVLAMTSHDYPVSPGDVYRVSYLAPTGLETIEATVNANLEANLGLFGRIAVDDLTFLSFRDRVLNLVEDAYPSSTPEMALRSVGRFTVHVSGAVSRSGPTTVTGLARLSDLLRERALSTASSRDVIIESSGRRRSFDVFTALRDGVDAQNPYLRPGDRIEVSFADRQIVLDGEVRVPGIYSLRRSDTLPLVIDRYGRGLTADARPTDIRIRRTSHGDPRTIRVDLTDSATFVTLEHGDTIFVPSATTHFPALQIQGAVMPASGQIWQPFRRGEFLVDALGAIAEEISPEADLAGALFYRSGVSDPVPVDAAELLYGAGGETGPELRPGDRLFIPSGLLTVTVSGEVAEPGVVSAAPSLTVAEFLADRLLQTASTRDVRVRYASGEERVIDLFLAQRTGDASQNPRLQPGMEIHVSAATRTVTVSGEVNRPGRYQLLTDEELATLVNEYAGGATLDADLGSITIERTETDLQAGRQVITLGRDEWRSFVLRDGDDVTVPDESDSLPVVVLEGAVTSDRVFGRIERRLVPGETLAQFVLRNRDEILGDADLGGAVLERSAGGTVPVDLQPIVLGETTQAGTIELSGGDVLSIPFAQRVVIVTGAVARGGEFPYIPGRTWDYYVSLAGGIDHSAHWGRHPQLSDPDGERLNANLPVPPETRIHIPVNNPITLYLAPLTTVLSSLTAVISFYNLIVSQ
ncbi:MAG: SLBB domain-containing protein [Spirochaetales bacterium]